MEPIMRIVLADTHQLVRDALKTMLCVETEIEVVADTHSCDHLEQLVFEQQPDVLITDSKLRDGESLDLLANLRNRYPDLKIIVYSSSKSPSLLKAYDEIGVAALLLKEDPAAALIDAIFECNVNEAWRSPACAQKIAHQEIKFSQRETQVLHMLYDGIEPIEAAQRMNLSVRSIEKHLENIMRKLSVNKRYKIWHAVGEVGLFPA